jgi:ABC-type amino acid transport substrate-binding protein
MKISQITIFLFFSILAVSYKAIGSQTKATLRIVAPYLPENVEMNGEEGRDLKIFKTILDCVGYDVKVDVQPYMRHVKSFLAEQKYAGIMTIPSGLTEIKNQTESYISYHNGVIVRAEDFPKGVKGLDSLKGKHVISFLGGKELLRGLKNKTDSFASYTETATQYRHNEMLMKGRVDGVFSDGLIFMAHQKRLLKKEPQWSKIKVKFYRIFSVNPFFAAFKDSKITKKFNSCLSKLNRSGALNVIERSFAGKYHSILGEEYSAPLMR